MKFAETLSIRRKTADIVISQNKSRFFGGTHGNDIENILLKIHIQRTETHHSAVGINCACPRFNIFIDPRPVTENGLQQDAEFHIRSGKFGFQRPVAFQKFPGFLHSRNSFWMQGQTVKHNIISGTVDVIDRLSGKSLFFTGSTGNDIQECEFFGKKVFHFLPSTITIIYGSCYHRNWFRSTLFPILRRGSNW